MTKTFRLLLALTTLTIFSCKNGGPQSYEIAVINGHPDTINLVDANGRKQGIWLMPISKDTMVMRNDTGYSAKTITTGELIRMLKERGNQGFADIKIVNGKLVAPAALQSYEVNMTNHDTINKTDVTGKKQGHWIVFNRFSDPGKIRPVEAGDYIDDKKQGSWNFYDSTGQVNRTVEYKDDVPLNK